MKSAAPGDMIKRKKGSSPFPGPASSREPRTSSAQHTFDINQSDSGPRHRPVGCHSSKVRDKSVGITDTGDDSTCALLERALRSSGGGVPWPHVRLMVRGAGGAGKTCTIAAMAGKHFNASSTSTVGAGMLDVEMHQQDFALGELDCPLRPYSCGNGEYINALAAHAALDKGDEVASQHGSMLDAIRSSAAESTQMISPHAQRPLVTDHPVIPSELIIQYRTGELQRNTVFRVQDTGGQPHFLQILELLIAPGSTVYMVVFSLVLLRDSFESCVDQVIEQIHSIHILAGGSPLVLAGTRKDVVSQPALKSLSERIMTELRQRCTPAIVKLVMNTSSENGELCFFGIENSKGYKGDASIRELVRAISVAADQLPSMKLRTPLPWLEVFEKLRLLSGKERHVKMETVQQLAKECGMPHPGITLEQELPAMLTFLHSLNVVLWWDTPELRDLVVLDVQWLIDASTCFIRDFELKDHTERYERMKDLDQEAIRREPAAWAQLTRGRATLHRKLLDILWQHADFAERKVELLDLMTRFGLVVPVPGRRDEYLVPPLLPQAAMFTSPWGWPTLAKDAAQLRIYFCLEGQDRADQSIIYEAADLCDGFLPISVFHKLCVGAVGSSYMNSSGVQVALCRQRAFVQFDKEFVVLSYVPEESSVIAQLSSNGKSGSGGLVVDRLRVLLAQELTTCFNLRYRMMVPFPDNSLLWVDLDALPLAKASPLSKPFSLRGEPCDIELLKAELAFWFTLNCRFYFILADKLRETPKVEFPKMLRLQDMKLKFPDWVVTRTIMLDEACQDAYREEFAAVSHRWEDAEDPDPTGMQLVFLKEHLKCYTQIKFVFYDYMCLPQGADKTRVDKAEFASMLPNINFLYIGTSVLILLDYTFLARFWTQFEAWLSFQMASADGLVGAPAGLRRCTIQCVHDTPEVYAKALMEQWSNCNVATALKHLSADSVTVTNRSDKEVQLRKIGQLDETVRHLMLSLVSKPAGRTLTTKRFEDEEALDLAIFCTCGSIFLPGSRSCNTCGLRRHGVEQAELQGKEATFGSEAAASVPATSTLINPTCGGSAPTTDAAIVGNIQGLAQLLEECKMDCKLQVAVAWCEEEGVESIDDILEFDLVPGFLAALQPLKHVPELRLCKAFTARKAK